MTIVDEEQQKQQPPPAATLETLQQKIDECANTIIGLHTIYRDRKKTIIQQLQEIRQLAKDLNIDDIRLRKMVSQSFTIMGVSSSWMRKLLPVYLKSTKHTRKDYLELQQQRDQQSLQQQRQQELAELTSSLSTKNPTLEQQPSDKEKITKKVTTPYGNNNVIAAVKPQTQNEQIAILEEKDTVIRNLENKIQQSQEEIMYLRDGSTAQQPQYQQQQEETFTALGCLELQNNDMPIRVIVNVKTKAIQYMEIAYEVIKGY